MKWRDGESHFGVVSIALHWAVAISVIVLLVLGLQAFGLPRGPERSAILHAHVSIAMTVLPLVIVRTWWRMRHGKPTLPPMHPLARRAASVTWKLLLVLILVQYLSGPLIVWAHDRSIEIFGVVAIPSPIGGLSDSAEIFVLTHRIIAFGLIGVIGLHLCGALWHLIVLKDGVAGRMFGRRPDQTITINREETTHG